MQEAWHRRIEVVQNHRELGGSTRFNDHFFWVFSHFSLAKSVLEFFALGGNL